MKDFIDALFVGIIATAIYEFGKIIFLRVIDFIKIRSLSFSISGYWCSNVEYISKNNTEAYEAFELIKIQYKKEIVYVKMYQLTTDGRKSCYKGTGFWRGDKLAFAYKETHHPVSNQVGTIILRYRNIMEHQIFLVGNYHEFRHNNYRSDNRPYIIKKYNMKIWDKIKSIILGKRYLYHLMQKEEFINECKNMPKVR